MKIYCASDFHIGYERSNYLKIEKFLNQVKDNADRLILCGDIFDLWRSTPEILINQEPYKSIYELLVSIGNIIPTTIVFGNHDYNLYKQLDLGCINVSDDFIENSIYYTHGWRFDIKQKLGSYFYYWIVKYFPHLYQKYFKKPTEIIDKEEQIYNEDRIYNEVIKFYNKNNYKYIIMGHTHNPIIINDKIGDCGDFVDSCSFITIDGDKMELNYI